MRGTTKTLAKIDEALAAPEHRALREALDLALDAVQELDDDDQPLRLDRADRSAALEAIQAGGFPASEELAAAYTHLAGLSLGADDGPLVEVLDPDELLDVNREQPNLRDDRPGLAFFASDGGDGFYAIDVEGATTGAAGTVVLADRGSSRYDRVAASLADFLRAAAAGELD